MQIVQFMKDLAHKMEASKQLIKLKRSKHGLDSRLAGAGTSIMELIELCERCENEGESENEKKDAVVYAWQKSTEV